MDSNNTPNLPTAIKAKGISFYLTVGAVLCLDLLMLWGRLPPGLLIPALMLSLGVIYIAMLQRGNVNRTELCEAEQKTNNPNHSKAHPERDAALTYPQNQISLAPVALNDARLLLLSGNNKERREITDHLRGWGMDFAEVENSARAFALLIEAADSGNPYHMVLVDQSGLDIEECQFAIALRAEPLLQSLSLIHYGNSALPSRTEQLHTAGYSRTLASPLDKTLLFKALHNAIETSLQHHNVVQLLDHYETERGMQPLDILIACSNPNECRKIHRILNNAGHQAFVVSDSTQILDALDSHHFDLAILDADMSEISGTEAIKLYRFSHLNQPWVSFILLLDSPNSQVIQACEMADINHLMVKPVTTQRLLETVIRATQVTAHEHNNDVFDYPTASGATQYHDHGLTLDTHQLNELKQLGKEKDFLLELVNQFDKESNALMQSLRQSINGHDIDSIHDQGHKLKDTAGNLGALNLYRLAVRLTRTRHMDSPDNLGKLLADVENCRNETITALLEHLSEGNNSVYRKE